MISRIGRSLARLGGADLTILQKVPQERARFVQMALVLLTTSSIAAVSMFFALHNGVKVPSAAAAGLALLWGIVILNLDRFLIVSMQMTRDRRRLLWMALPRLLLATMVALTVSTPLVLRVFASDINHQLAISQVQQSAQSKYLQADSAQAREASQLRSQINADQAAMAAQARVTALRQQVQAAQHAAIAAQQAWQCEAEGLTCAGASGRTGNGELARQKQIEYQRAADNYISTAAQLKTAENDLQTARKATAAQNQVQPGASLDDLKKQLAALESQIQDQVAAASRANSQNTGLIAQLQALSKASSQSITLAVARYIVAALFFLIEILPVVVQFLLNLGPPSAYELVSKIRNDTVIDTLVMERDETRHIEERDSQARLNIETDRRKREEDLGKHANQYIAEQMQRVLDESLKQWSDQMRATMLSGGTVIGLESRGEALPRWKTQPDPAYTLPDADNI